MEWLQHHMRKHLVEGHSEANVLSLRHQPSLTPGTGARALELVERAIEYIRRTEQDSAERHARAESLARNAIEQLNTAAERLRFSEAARRAAEGQFEGAAAKLRETETELERTAAALTAAQTKISAVESRAHEAEMRATEAENALKRIEASVNSLLLARQLSSGEVAA